MCVPILVKKNFGDVIMCLIPMLFLTVLLVSFKACVVVVTIGTAQVVAVVIKWGSGMVMMGVTYDVMARLILKVA